MAYVLPILFSTVATWISFLIVLPIASRIAGFSVPVFRDYAWKMALIAIATSAVYHVLEPTGWLISNGASIVVFWVCLTKWLQLDFTDAAIIVIVSWLVQLGLIFLLVLLFAGLIVAAA